MKISLTTSKKNKNLYFTEKILEVYEKKLFKYIKAFESCLSRKVDECALASALLFHTHERSAEFW
jgi:hypothetical protein